MLSDRLLLERWIAGDREAVEAEIAGYARPDEGRPVLEALDFLCRFERGEPIPKPAASAYRHIVVLGAILDCGSLAAARQYASTVLDRPDAGTASLPSLVLAAPETPSGQHELEFRDDPAAEVQVVPRPGSRTVLFVFTGGAHRFFGPLVVMHQWFRRLDASIVYLRDLDGMFYAGGIGSLGPGYDDTIGGLFGIVGSLGAARILCTGSSSGAFGALRYGLDLSAEGVLSLSGPSRLDSSGQRVLMRQRRRRPSAIPIDPDTLDMAAVYRRARRRPSVRMTFGERNEIDRTEAENMAPLAGVLLDPIPGVEEHNILPSLGRDGFEARLHWLAFCTAYH